MPRFRKLALIAAFLGVCEAHAQTPGKLNVESGVNYRRLDSGYSEWRGAYIRMVLRAGSKDTVNAEVLRQRQFGDTGTFFSVGDSHTINEKWYSYLSVGGSSGGFFFPRVRVDGQLSRKWLAKKSLVTSVGVGLFEPKTIHRNFAASMEAVYYFTAPWIVQGGVRWNHSSPGAVLSRSQFIALTEGREGKHYVVLRGEVGREAYQLVGATTALVDFPSRNATVTWKQWVGGDWGFNAVAEYYKSSAYRRAGVSLGLFKSF
jgi:YaiO family outer membrane protein